MKLYDMKSYYIILYHMYVLHMDFSHFPSISQISSQKYHQRLGHQP